MVGGQTLDMDSENTPIELHTLEQIHKAKTGALLKFSILSAADIANVNDEILNTLDCFSEHLGLMFQIKDDLLDVYGDEKKLGKKVGSDVENHKSTYVSLLGKSGAEEKLKYHKDAAIDAVNQLKSQYDVEPLLEIVDLFYSRDH